MTLVGGVIAPHPPIIVPGVGGSRLKDVESTLTAMHRVSVEAAEKRPNTIVLLSPHAPISPGEMGVSLAERYQGSLALSSEFPRSRWSWTEMWTWLSACCPTLLPEDCP